MDVKSILSFTCVFIGYGTLSGIWALECWDNVRHEGRAVKVECKGSCGSKKSTSELFKKEVGCWNMRWSDGCKTVGTSRICACNQALCNKPDNQLLNTNGDNNKDDNYNIMYQEVQETRECWVGVTGPGYGYQMKIKCHGSCMKRERRNGGVRHVCFGLVVPEGCTTCSHNTTCCFCNSALCNGGPMPNENTAFFQESTLSKPEYDGAVHPYNIPVSDKTGPKSDNFASTFDNAGTVSDNSLFITDINESSSYS